MAQCASMEENDLRKKLEPILCCLNNVGSGLQYERSPVRIHRRVLTYIFCVLHFCALLYAISVAVKEISKYKDGVLTLYIFYILADLLALFLAISFRRRRDRLLKILEDIESLKNEIPSCPQKCLLAPLRWLKPSTYVASLLAPGLSLIFMLLTIPKKSHSTDLIKEYSFDTYVEDRNDEYFPLFFVVVSIELHCCFTMASYSSLFISAVCVELGNILDVCRLLLADKINSLSVTDVNILMKTYEGLQNQICEMDSVLNLPILFTLSYQVIVIGLGVNALPGAVDDPVHPVWILHEISLLIVPVCFLLRFLLSASQVHSKNRILTKQLMKAKEHFPYELRENKVDVLMSNLVSQEGLGLTVMGMFSITGGTITAIFIFLVTYVVLLYQIG